MNPTSTFTFTFTLLFLEPASFPGFWHVNVTGTQLAKDFQQLNLLLKKSAAYSSAYRNAIITGPDAGDVHDKLLQE